jgi:hypothetical protein
MPDGIRQMHPNTDARTLILGIGIGILIGGGIAALIPEPKTVALQPIRENIAYPLISPLLACDNGSEILSDAGSRPHRREVKKVIDDALGLKNADAISLYYRDLNSGSWLSINGNQHYAPASLFKVPYMMYLYKRAEDDPSLLQKRVAPVPIETTSLEYFSPATPLNASSTYSVEELIERMIVGSDNQALDTLFTVVSPTELNELYEQLRVKLPEHANDDFVTARDYGMFFRILFNASYLSEKDSQKALELLSRSEFRKGLMAWIPSGVTVANKFGERLDREHGAHQLHDCGIVYVPKHPYLVCIMTKGKDLDRMANAIASVSDIIYKQVTTSAD